jgi:hypothetical protein
MAWALILAVSLYPAAPDAGAPPRRPRTASAAILIVLLGLV